MANFILTDKIDEDICKNLISIFESNANLHYEGKIIGKGGEYDQVDTSRKKSIDFEFSDLDITEGDFNYKVIEDYYNSLKDVLFNYTETFPEVNTIPYFRATNARIQRYDKDGHFSSWHYERGPGESINRCLVYMTYLNDVEDGGETYFKYQNEKIKPETGKTIIWPADWTHTHMGLGPRSGYKYIITGWSVHT